MKTIFKVSVLALMGAALLASCAKEFDYEPTQKVTKTFTLTFAQPDTKVAVTNEGKTTWEVGDEIMIHGGSSGQERQKVTLTADDISADGKKATITFDVNPYDRTADGILSQYYAQYPASLVPEGNMYYECRFSATNDFLMAACDVDDTFVFYNLCGIIAFEANGEFDNFKFEGNNGETVGYSTVYQVRVRNDASGMVVNYNKPGNESGTPVSMKSFAAELKDGVNYIFLPAGANFSGGFTFKFYDGMDLVKVAKSETAVKIDPGKILALGDISSHIEDYVPPTTSDHKPAAWAEAATDLSYGKQAMANCYVIKAPGAYKIPALKGNSEEAVGNVFDVELVWETYNNETEVVANSVIAEVDFDNDNLYFKTPDALKAGNALIAAKDSEGKIMWSWHIWIPETTIGTVDGSNICNAIVMDRNLGALRVTETGTDVVASVESFGLMYQWGRKDPFPGPKRVNSSTLALIAGTPFVLKDQSKTEYVSGDTVKGSMTQAEANQNPTVFGNYGGGDWDEAANADRWTREGKTIYDPCPAGYMVMKRESSSVLWNTTNIATAATEAGMTWASSLDGHWFSITDASGNKLAFPLAGYIDDCDVNNVPYIEYPGKRAAVYAAYLSGSSPYHLNIREDKTDYHKAGSTSAARGASIRCVQIDGWVDPSPAEPKVLTVERVWGKYSTSDASWNAYYGGTAGGERNVATDGEYVYIPETGTKKLWAISVANPENVTAVDVSTVADEGTFKISCPRVIKNTDSSINGGKDVLVVSNMTEGDPKAYFYVDGIAAAPKVVTLTTWASRRLGDTFTYAGTLQEGVFFFKDFNSAQGTVTFPMKYTSATSTLYLSARLVAPAVTGAGAYFPFPDNMANGVSSVRGGGAAQLVETTANFQTAEGAVTPTLTDLSGYYTDAAFRFFEYNDQRFIAYTRQVDGSDGRLFIIDGAKTDSWATILNTRHVIYHAAIQNSTEGDAAPGDPSPKSSGNSGMDLDIHAAGDALIIAVVKQNVGLSVFKMYMK